MISLIGEVGGWTGILLGYRFIKTYYLVVFSKNINLVFSLLGLAYSVRGKVGQRFGLRIFICIVIGISAAMLYQLTLSIQKLQRNLTGTKVEYIKTDPNLNISISICNFYLYWPQKNITELVDIDSISQRVKANTEWIEYKDTMSDMFMWKEDNNTVYLCKTKNFTGEEVKIVHSLYNDDAIFLHDPSFITGETSLKIARQELDKNKILLLNAKQIQRIEEEHVCSDLIEYDSCRDDYLAQEFNNTFGHIYFNMK